MCVYVLSFSCHHCRSRAHYVRPVLLLLLRDSQHVEADPRVFLPTIVPTWLEASANYKKSWSSGAPAWSTPTWQIYASNGASTRRTPATEEALPSACPAFIKCCSPPSARNSLISSYKQSCAKLNVSCTATRGRTLASTQETLRYSLPLNCCCLTTTKRCRSAASAPTTIKPHVSGAVRSILWMCSGNNEHANICRSFSNGPTGQRSSRVSSRATSSCLQGVTRHASSGR